VQAADGIREFHVTGVQTCALPISGNGDVLEPEEGLIAIGSGGPYAQSAARALLRHTDLSAREIVESSLSIAGEICIYTNQNQTRSEERRAGKESTWHKIRDSEETK